MYLPIAFETKVRLVCPQCRSKSVYFFSTEVTCIVCSWSRPRRYPLPEPPSFISVQGTDDAELFARRLNEGLAQMGTLHN
jgi:hypothetical protein